MKKKQLKTQLSLSRTTIAKFEIDNIKGGDIDNTLNDCNTRYFKCSDIICLTNVTCYHTYTCEPVQTVTNNTVNEVCYTNANC